LTAALAAAATIVLAQPQHARAADPDFAGKTIRFMVGFGAGGGYDAYSRMLAPYFERELGAQVVVENLPGAGGMKVLNRVAVAPPEALVMTIVNGTGAGLQQVVGLKGMRFDLVKFGYLGVLDSPRWIWLVSPNSDINTPQDATKRAKVLSWGGSGKISGTSDGAAFTCHILKLNCNIVTGYKGSRATALAVAQGEMDALYVSETSAFKYVEAKNAKAVATMNRKRSGYFPNLPTITEQMTLDKEQLWWLDYRNTLESMGRILVVPPSTPKAVLAKLQAVTEKIVGDPKFLAEAKKRKRDINFIPAHKAKEAVVTVLESVTPEQKAAIRKVVLGN
jgi:tripartite-type tricarboxylate transporter receptor subunit TctC